MKFDNVLIVAAKTPTNPQEVIGSAKALRSKNAAKARAVDLLWLEFDPGRSKLAEAVYNYTLGQAEQGGVDYKAALGIYLVCHISGFPENLGTLLREHVKPHLTDGSVRIGYLCLVVCSFVPDRHRGDLETIDPKDNAKTNRLLVQLLRDLRANNLVPAKVSAWDKPVFVFYEGVKTQAPMDKEKDYEGRKFLQMTSGGGPGFLHHKTNSRSHKLSWAYDPGTGMYRMGGEVRDAVASVDLLTISLPLPTNIDLPVTIALHDDRAEWQPDEAAHNCPKCHAVFGFMTWRCHCRQCGRVFCKPCCNFEKQVTRPVRESGTGPLLAQSLGLVRVCGDCMTIQRV